MLPLHGQSTAAVKVVTHRAGFTSYDLARGNVFVKQSMIVFVEFLTIIYYFSAYKVFNVI